MGPAAHRGPVRRRTVARCPCAADGGTAGGRFCDGFPRGGGREGPGCGVSGAGPSCHLPRLCGAAAGGRSEDARAPPEGSWEEEEEAEEETTSSLSASSSGVWVLPEEYTGSSPSSTHCLVSQWKHVPASVLEAF